MTHYQVTVDAQTMQRLFSGDSQLGQLLEVVVNQVLEAQVTEQLHAGPYERSDERRGCRNGYKPRTLTTRVGQLALRVPQVREGQFSAGVRSERAMAGLRSLRRVNSRDVTSACQRVKNCMSMCQSKQPFGL